MFRRFNEAAGIHRRKRGRYSTSATPTSVNRFNEAAGIHRRKLGNRQAVGMNRVSVSFNEAAGIHRRKQLEARRYRIDKQMLQ